MEDDLIDLRGFRCPLPVLKTRHHLRKLEPGTQLWVETDDPLAGVDIPHFCNEHNQELVRQEAFLSPQLLPTREAGK